MKNRKLTFVAVLMLISPVLMSSSCGSEPDNSTNEGVQQVSENRIIIDVRTQQEYNIGAVEGALNIPLSELENRLDEVSGFDEIVVYCQSGKRSAKAKIMLDNAGYKYVVNGGGIQQMKQQ